ncbi:hypothetical protein KM043_016420 [Ampulex compressa]|nr:hypothetical protein KM043_016420 [Ampulex compressa]
MSASLIAVFQQLGQAVRQSEPRRSERASEEQREKGGFSEELGGGGEKKRANEQPKDTAGLFCQGRNELLPFLGPLKCGGSSSGYRNLHTIHADSALVAERRDGGAPTGIDHELTVSRGRLIKNRFSASEKARADFVVAWVSFTSPRAPWAGHLLSRVKRSVTTGSGILTARYRSAINAKKGLSADCPANEKN